MSFARYTEVNGNQHSGQEARRERLFEWRVPATAQTSHRRDARGKNVITGATRAAGRGKPFAVLARPLVAAVFEPTHGSLAPSPGVWPCACANFR